MFKTIINRLEGRYGNPKPPKTCDAFEMIVLENVAYLASDSRREAAFDALRERIGVDPLAIAAASMDQLTDITRPAGIHPERRAQRLKECAQIALNEFAGDLSSVLELPLSKAIKAFRQFPSIGGPGAEKILLFTKTHPVLALESNGLRVLLRLGFGEEKRNYAASYKSVQEVLASEIGDDCESLIAAHLVLRQHGRETCKSSRPKCDQCPVSGLCEFLKTAQKG